MIDVDTRMIPVFYSEQQKQELVDVLSKIRWERCVTLTTKRDYELPDLIGFVRDFVRRVDGMTHSRSQYLFGLSGQENFERERTFNTRLHVHGVIAGVGDITNKEIEGCWRSVETRFRPSSDLSFTLPNTLGFSKVVHYDGNPDWLFYVLNQTRKGEVLTNLEVTI